MFTTDEMVCSFFDALDDVACLRVQRDGVAGRLDAVREALDFGEGRLEAVLGVVSNAGCGELGRGLGERLGMGVYLPNALRTASGLWRWLSGSSNTPSLAQRGAFRARDGW